VNVIAVWLYVYVPERADILSKFSGMLDGLRKFGDTLIRAFNKVKQVFMVVCKRRRYLLVSQTV